MPKTWIIYPGFHRTDETPPSGEGGYWPTQPQDVAAIAKNVDHLPRGFIKPGCGKINAQEADRVYVKCAFLRFVLCREENPEISEQTKSLKQSRSEVKFCMIVDELKSKIDTLTPEERHQISAYLTKLELENDPTYWEAIRKRIAEDKTTEWISAEDI